MITLEWGIFGLRAIAAVLLYSFLGVALYIVWQDLRLTTRRVTWQAHRKPRLRVERSPSDAPYRVGDIIPLDAVTVMGSHGDNHIVLSALSLRHGRLLNELSMWWFEPFEDSPPILLNDIPLTAPTLLNSGDGLKVGDFHAIFEA